MTTNKLLKYAEAVDAFRIVPRTILLGYGILLWDVIQWYMDIPIDSLSSEHKWLITTILGICGIVTGMYFKTGRTWTDDKKGNDKQGG